MSLLDDEIDDELFATLVNALPEEAAPPAALKESLMQAASEGRFGERFADQMAKATDLARDVAKKLLDAIDDAARWTGDASNMLLFHIEPGPRLAGASICGFIRLAPGQSFPEHTHRGHEVVLIIQGGYVDTEGVVHRAGEEHHMVPGSTHGFTALPGPDLVYLSVVEDGFNIGEARIGPDSPDY